MKLWHLAAIFVVVIYLAALVLYGHLKIPIG